MIESIIDVEVIKNNEKNNKEEFSFFMWLEINELMTKKEYEKLPEYKKENYRREFKMFQKGVKRYN